MRDSRYFIFLFFLMDFNIGLAMSTGPKMISAKIEAPQEVVVKFSQPIPRLSVTDISIDQGIAVVDLVLEKEICRIRTSPFDVQKNYRIAIRGIGERELQPDGILNGFYSDKPLGCHFENGATVFRVFAPRATRVEMELFEKPEHASGKRWEMSRDPDGVWELRLPGQYSGKWYGYRIHGPKGEGEMFNPSHCVADPYAVAMATQNLYLHPAKAYIPNLDSFDWENDTWICPTPEDLIIYELHVRDMTAHPSSGVTPEKRGKYLGLIEEGKVGGIDYIASLGVNAVELLPVHEFANIEIDYKNPQLPIYNDWNPYARNHWGYMTSGFFAPESYYASDGNLEPNRWSGTQARGISEFKALVKAFHRRGIAVILDVVYNHVSHYDLNPFKYIDKKYYFRLDDNQAFLSTSGCGNDFKTERPMARRLIVESVLYWMKEYHIDGFRFDLAAMLDEETLEAITQKARALNPNVILIAEPWGGGKYGQEPFSRLGWCAWNDRFRNAVKGQNPFTDTGFIFGRLQGNNTVQSMRNYILGDLKAHGGPFYTAGHSVNYLECHDDHTLGDFIRLALGIVQKDTVIQDRDRHAQLSIPEMRLHRLGALFLLTSQGVVMLHEGQEFGRSKVIAMTEAPDPHVGKIDGNSYNKDNETNWLNYLHAEMNRELVDYYRGLIALRKKYRMFRWAKPEDIAFLPTGSPFCIAFRLCIDRPEKEEGIVVLNGDPKCSCTINLPSGQWFICVNAERAGATPIHRGVQDRVTVPPTSGLVLIKG